MRDIRHRLGEYPFLGLNKRSRPFGICHIAIQRIYIITKYAARASLPRMMTRFPAPISSLFACFFSISFVSLRRQSYGGVVSSFDILGAFEKKMNFPKKVDRLE